MFICNSQIHVSDLIKISKILELQQSCVLNNMKRYSRQRHYWMSSSPQTSSATYICSAAGKVIRYLYGSRKYLTLINMLNKSQIRRQNGIVLSLSRLELLSPHFPDLRVSKSVYLAFLSSTLQPLSHRRKIAGLFLFFRYF